MNPPIAVSAICLLSGWVLSIWVGLFYRPRLTARLVMAYNITAVNCITCQSHHIWNVIGSSVSRYAMLRISGRPAQIEKSDCAVFTAGPLNVWNGWETTGDQRAALRLSKHYRSVRWVSYLTTSLKILCCKLFVCVRVKLSESNELLFKKGRERYQETLTRFHSRRQRKGCWWSPLSWRVWELATCSDCRMVNIPEIKHSQSRWIQPSRTAKLWVNK